MIPAESPNGPILFDRSTLNPLIAMSAVSDSAGDVVVELISILPKFN